MKPFISVVICAYQAEDTIAEAIDSVSRQTFRDLEIIVVDDGSRDGTAAIVERLRTREKRLKLYRQLNSGVAMARNKGVALARGDLIAFLDADDRWSPTHLAWHEQVMRQSPSIGVSFSRARFIDTKGRPTGEVSRTPIGVVPAAAVLAGNPCTTCSTMVVSAQCFREVGLFRDELRRAEDQEWLLRVALSGWTLVCDGRESVDYRTSPQGLSSDLAGMLDGFRSVLATARRLAPDLVAREGAVAEARMLRYLARRALRLGLGRVEAGKYFLGAVLSSPRLVVAEPKATLATLAGLVAPVLARPLPRAA